MMKTALNTLEIDTALRWNSANVLSLLSINIAKTSIGVYHFFLLV